MNAKSITALGLSLIFAAGCSTGVEDIQDAREDYIEAQSEADEIVADVREESHEQLEETRELVMEEVEATRHNVDEVRREDAANVADEQTGLVEVAEVASAGEVVLEAAQNRRNLELAKAKKQADAVVADAKTELDKTRQAALDDAREQMAEHQKALQDAELQLIKAKAKTAAAKVRLKQATVEDRKQQQADLNEAQQTAAAAEAEVATAKEELEVRRVELKKVEMAAK